MDLSVDKQSPKVLELVIEMKALKKKLATIEQAIEHSKSLPAPLKLDELVKQNILNKMLEELANLTINFSYFKLTRYNKELDTLKMRGYNAIDLDELGYDEQDMHDLLKHYGKN